MDKSISNYGPENRTKNNYPKKEENEPLFFNEDGVSSYLSGLEVEPKNQLIDSVAESSTFTKYPLLLLFCSIFIFLADGMEMLLMTTILIPFQNKFELRKIMLEFVSSTIFLGVAIGSGTGFLISNKIGRILTVKISLAGIVLFHLLMALILILPIFIICRILIGFFLGVLIPICLNIISEYQSIKIRGFALMIVWAFFSIGQILLNTIALGVMPELEHDKLKQFLAWLTPLPVVAFIISLFFLYDSPRHLILKDTDESLIQSYEILDSMAKRQLTDEEKRRIVHEVKHLSRNKEVYGKVSEMFNKKYLLCTILLIILYLFYAFIIYGFVIISELTLDKLIETHNEKKVDYSNRDIIINQILLCVGEGVGNVIGGLLVIPKIGRKTLLMILAVITGCIYFPLPYGVKIFQILSPITLGLANLYGNFITLYNVENYPTKLRDISTSFSLMTFRISDFISQFVYLGLFWINYKVPYFVSFAVLIISCILSFFLPFESSGKPLDE